MDENANVNGLYTVFWWIDVRMICFTMIVVVQLKAEDMGTSLVMVVDTVAIGMRRKDHRKRRRRNQKSSPLKNTNRSKRKR